MPSRPTWRSGARSSSRPACGPNDREESGHDALRQRMAVIRNLAGNGEPDPVPLRMFHAMRERLSQCPQAERMAAEKGMQRNAAHQRAPRRLIEHLVELIDDELRELLCRLL